MDARQLGAYLATDDAFGQFRLSRWLCGRGALAAGQLSALVGRRVGRRRFFAAVRRASRLATVIRCPACERWCLQSEQFRIHWEIVRDGDAPDGERIDID